MRTNSKKNLCHSYMNELKIFRYEAKAQNDNIFIVEKIINVGCVDIGKNHKALVSLKCFHNIRVIAFLLILHKLNNVPVDPGVFYDYRTFCRNAYL